MRSKSCTSFTPGACYQGITVLIDFLGQLLFYLIAFYTSVIVGLFGFFVVLGTICDFYTNEYLSKYENLSRKKILPIEMDTLRDQKEVTTKTDQVSVPKKNSSE